MLTKLILLTVSFIARISAVKCICGGNQTAENGFGKKRVKWTNIISCKTEKQNYQCLEKVLSNSRSWGGAQGAAPPPLLIFRPKWGPKGKKKFFCGRPPPPPYLRVWMTAPPSPPYLKVWICHCFPLAFMLCCTKVVLTYQSVTEILWHDNSNVRRL